MGDGAERGNHVKAITLSLPTAQLAGRMRDRLDGSANKANQVIWTKGTRRLLVFVDSLKVRSVDGWLLAQLDAQTDQTGRQTLKFIFYAGRQHEGEGTHAAVVTHAATVQAAQIAEVWEHDLQRVLWDAVLDAIELSMSRAAAQAPNQPLTLEGYYADAQAFHVNILAGVS